MAGWSKKFSTNILYCMHWNEEKIELQCLHQLNSGRLLLSFKNKKFTNKNSILSVFLIEKWFCILVIFQASSHWRHTDYCPTFLQYKHLSGIINFMTFCSQYFLWQYWNLINLFLMNYGLDNTHTWTFPYMTN